MIATFADPFDTLFRLQRELEARRASDWLEDTTSGTGAFPPINVFQQGHDFVAIVELPGVSTADLAVQRRRRLTPLHRAQHHYSRAARQLTSSSENHTNTGFNS